ncbi:MAG: hypothetical protein K2N55_11390 [Lachnospiraceae bacterium]|nr:hypothetical protein [Lachnospiraceae bacterium]
MGELKKITCRSCGTEWECRTGCGMMHGRLEWVADLFPEDLKKKIKDYVGGRIFLPFTFSYELSYCKECQRIESVPVLRLYEDSKEYVGPCGQCGQKTELIEETGKTQCPVCRLAFLEIEDIGQWD